MSVGLVLEFDGVGREGYAAVNDILGIDMATGEGDWPDGLVTHLAGTTDSGFAVVEVWESQAEQQAFMESRLGAALQQGGLPAPSRMVWFDVLAHHNPGG